MRRSILAVSVAALLAAAPALADQRFPATLAGHAILPANTLIPAPADAPDAFKVSGKFAGPGNTRNERLASVPGMSGTGAGARPTGLSFPFEGQPVQGFSGIKRIGDGTYWTLTDNGFGSKANSADAMLMFHRIRPNFQTGAVERMETIFLHDPDRLVPFPIVAEGTAKRYLTGADFDLESIQPIGDSFWFGEEFGPYLIRADRQGKVTGVWATELGGRPVRSPDHPAVRTPGAPGGAIDFNLGRSRGYEGMAASPDGRMLYAMLEGPVFVDGRAEAENGREFLRVIEFDVAAARWTGRSFRYPLEINGNAIGDFNMIDATRALVIERDNAEGDPAQACPANAPAPTCFAAPARFKRVYVVSFEGVADGGALRKLGHIDLMDIADPQNRARQGGANGKLTFPFFTIENVDVVDAEHIIVGNDNNLPFSAGRFLTRADDNELILLRVPELLNAR
ncbi:MAG: esterase-like activity of phytase family protein [Tagaea sp.]|nr:esterase-like activity of phytase family protein [Tagaea sp.]